MRLLNLFFSPHRHSAAIAKERLKIVLAHERAGSHAPDFLPRLQRDLIDVVGRYVEIREDMIRVNLGKSGETSPPSRCRCRRAPASAAPQPFRRRQGRAEKCLTT